MEAHFFMGHALIKLITTIWRHLKTPQESQLAGDRSHVAQASMATADSGLDALLSRCDPSNMSPIHALTHTLSWQLATWHRVKQLRLKA